ncbi:MAG: DinB family protein [bacterium]|nr:DinB family protein [bacterium]
MTTTAASPRIDALRRQYALSWDMLEDALGRCTDAAWRAETTPPYAIARLAFHTVQSTQRYCRTGHRKTELDPFGFGGDGLVVAIDRIPAITDMRAYSDRVRRRVTVWLETLTDDTLAASDNAFQWTGLTIGERLVYTLKHFHHHLGQINLLLRQHGIAVGPWKCRP